MKASPISGERQVQCDFQSRISGQVYSLSGTFYYDSTSSWTTSWPSLGHNIMISLSGDNPLLPQPFFHSLTSLFWCHLRFFCSSCGIGTRSNQVLCHSIHVFTKDIFHQLIIYKLSSSEYLSSGSISRRSFFPCILMRPTIALRETLRRFPPPLASTWRRLK